MKLLYDVCHNIAKKEQHLIDGEQVMLLCFIERGLPEPCQPVTPYFPKFIALLANPS